jgi:hypothetical protein
MKKIGIFMKKNTVLKLSLLCTTLAMTTPAFAKFPYWDEVPQQKVEAPLTLKEFASKLSDYHAKRFAKLSPTQRKTALAYCEKERVTPDDAVDQIALEEGLRR